MKALQNMLGHFASQHHVDPDDTINVPGVLIEGLPVPSMREELAMRFAVAMVGNPAMASYLNSHETRAMIAVKAADAVLARLEATAPVAPGDDSPTGQ